MRNRIITSEYIWVCQQCGQIFILEPCSPPWWEANLRAEEGFMGATIITGDKCGCIPQDDQPYAPYRVFGHDHQETAFDWPFSTFPTAARKFRKLKRVDMYNVFVSGVPEATKARLYSKYSA